MRALILRLSAASLALIELIALLSIGTLARADNAGFALAPKGAVFAVDARGVADLLEGDRGALVRPVLEAFAGPDALATFDLLAKRANAPGARLAQEVFGGRIAFMLPAAAESSAWLLGFESDDQRCQHLLLMLSAKVSAPGRYDSASEHLALRRVGGWLLIAPSSAEGRALIDASALRVPAEDAGESLIGEPLMQDLLASDASVRIFMRHRAPLGGATTIALRGEKRGLHAEIGGSYDAPPLGLSPGHHELDAHLVRAFEDRAVLVVSNPANGIPGRSDAFWVALLPELVPPPAMRANLSGERVFLVGMSNDGNMPALACAWRIEDVDQAEVDQDHFMRGVSCAIGRSVEQGKALPPSDAARPSDAVQPSDAAPSGHPVAQSTNDRHPVARDVEPAHTHEADVAMTTRSCAELGPFADRYLGTPFKLGQCQLCWKTVATPCGGWQVYSSDPTWLASVAERLTVSSCSDDARTGAGGIGFCDGPRAATLLRRWQPLAVPGGRDRVSSGLAAVSQMLERMGRMRFRYELSGPRQIRASIDIEPLGRLLETPGKKLAAPVGDAPLGTSSQPSPKGAPR
jgi:hypothetical protein